MRRPFATATLLLAIAASPWIGACSLPSAPAAVPTTSAVSQATAAGPSSPAASASAGSSQPAPPAARVTSGLVSADGVRQWVQCVGAGPMTLVVIPGLGASSTDWSQVVPDLRRVTRTCVYDRPGLGRSPARPNMGETVDAGLLADELWSALHAAGERGPYVVLGHSFGGLIARAFVAQHRAQVRGVLLAEGVAPGDPTTGHYWTEAGHRVDMLASSAQTAGGPPLHGLPLLVLSASRPDADHLRGPTYGQPAWMTRLWVHQQQLAPELSSDSIQVIAHSGHVIQQDAPRVVVQAVRVLVDAVRDGRLLGCAAPWRALGATCR